MSKPETTRAVTDCGEFITDLDGGQFDRKLSIALSTVAAAVVDKSRKGEVTIKLKFGHIKNTSQVVIEHELKFEVPTESGKAAEEEKRATVLHVGRFGALSLAQPSLLDGASKQTNIEGT